MKLILFLLFPVLISANLYSQIKDGRRHNAFSGSVVVSVESGISIAASDYVGSRPDYMGKGMVELFFPSYSRSSFGLRIFGNTGFISEQDDIHTPPIFRTNVSTVGGGVVYVFNFADVFFPYLFAGAGHLWFNPKDDNGNLLPGNSLNLYDKTEINYLGELGFRYLITDNVSLNLSTGIQISPNDVWDDSREGATNDLMFTVMGGLSFAFLSEKDSDGDGVNDSKDMCPSTPPGIFVDASGCPKDFDKDGVPDYKDKCLSTLPGVQVDLNGCPLDNDKDGVPDYLDKCPQTAEGLFVDENGCPEDADKDGISDAEDKCPDTPYDVEVDSRGCPKDDDLDGVPDFRDKCPRTPAGEKVDQNGCSIEGDLVKIQTGVKEIILSAGASFQSGSSKILYSAYEDLNKLVYEMKADPISRWRIEGYTDNVGSDASNKRLSLKRAEAVRDYLVSRGISRTRFEVFGFGKDNPVASNSTEEGRAKNRRVRILRIN